MFFLLLTNGSLSVTVTCFIINVYLCRRPITICVSRSRAFFFVSEKVNSTLIFGWYNLLCRMEVDAVTSARVRSFLSRKVFQIFCLVIQSEMIGGKGPRSIAVMWLMTFLSFVLVILRLYTRIYVVKAVGIDDHVFNLAWVCYTSSWDELPSSRMMQC